ncbi:MAG: hypothetical protein ACTSYM_05060 [Candidatus Baldrarchaeia archaeon]
MKNLIIYIATKIEELSFLLEIERKIFGKHNEKLSKYLKKHFGFSLEALMTTALMFGLFFGAVSFLFLIKMNLLLATVLSILIFCVVFVLIKNSITSTYGYERTILASLAPLVFYEFSLNLEIGSVFEALQSISRSKYPIISRNFKEILNKISLGQKPEKQLLHYAFTQPSSDFKIALLTVLNTNEKAIDIGKYFQEAENEYEKINKEIEIKILLTIIISTFLPLLLTMIYVFWDYPWLIFTVPLTQLLFHVFSIKDYRMFILKRMITAGNELSELEECAEFLEVYGKFLGLGYSPERALTKTVEIVSEKTREKLKIIIKRMYSDLVPLRMAWSDFITNFKHPFAMISLKIVNKMTEKSSKDAGEKILKIAAKLREKAILERKRETLISAQRLKARIITLASALLLGFVASLIPIVIYSSAFVFGKLSISSVNSLSIAMSLLMAVIIMTYTNCKATVDKNIKLQVMLAVLAFLLAYSVNSFLQHLI